MGFNSGFKGLMVIYTSQKTTSVPKFPSAGLPSRITVFLNFMQFIIDYSNQVGRVAQSVKRLATGWTVGDRIPVEARFSAPVQTGPGANPASCTMGTGSFLGVNSGRSVTLTHHVLLVPLVMKE